MSIFLSERIQERRDKGSRESGGGLKIVQGPSLGLARDV